MEQEKPMSYDKKRYLRLRAAGICTTCKRRPAGVGRTECEECVERHKQKRSRHDRIRYQRHKTAGICPNCKKEPAATGRVQCEKCTEQHKQEREYLISHKICRQCRNEDAEPNRLLCWDCAEKARQRGQAYRSNMTADEREKQKVYNRIYSKNRRINRIEKGICIRCGQRKMRFGIQLCIDCHIRLKRYKESKKPDTLLRNERPDYGLCYICGNPSASDKKLCEKHLEVARKIYQKRVQILIGKTTYGDDLTPKSFKKAGKYYSRRF